MPPNPYRPFIIVASVVLGVAALYWAQKVLIPISLAILLSFILNPLVVSLQKSRIGRVPAVILVVFMTFGVLGATGVAITHEVNGLLAELPAHKENIRRKILELRETGKGTVFEKFQQTVQELTQEIMQEQQQADEVVKEPIDVRIQTSGLSRVQATLGPAAEVLADVALVIVLVIFILVQREDLRNRLVRLVAHGRLISATHAIDEASRRISRYLLSQVLVNAGFGLLLSLCLALVGVPYAFLWGFLAGVLRFIPYVGSWVALAMLVAFSFVIFPQWARPLITLGIFLALEVVTANVVEPLVFGHSTGISAVALLVAAAFWTWLWGPIGLILSTPITACLVVLGKYVADLEFFDVLLGDQPVLETHIRYYQRLLARDQDEATDLVEEFLSSHPVEAVYDEILIPALVAAKRDKGRGELSDEDERFILAVTRDLIDDLTGGRAAMEPAPAAETAEHDGQETPEQPKTLVLGCPAQDEEDELALRMFRALLQPAGFEVEVLSSTLLTAEVIARVNQDKPAVLCIGSLPPGGLTRARFLGKRLHAELPSLTILVGRWGCQEDLKQAADRLRAGGATHVGQSLIESRNQAVPLAQALAHTQGVLADARS